MMIYKSTCFRALALVVFLSSSVFSYSQVSNSDVVFSGTFGGAITDNFTYGIPTGSEPWAGFANEDVSLYPLSFTEGGDVTFTGATDGTDVDVYFRFEYNPYPDTEPSFSTSTVTVSGTTEASYTVDIPSQGGNTFSSFLLYINTLDSPVTLTNVTLTSTDVADSCSDIVCTGDEVCVNGACVISGCTDDTAENYNSNATSDDGTCTYSLSVLTVTTTVCDAASSVQMTGPWWDWDPTAGPAASDNGDGTWTFTFDPAPTDNMEYLLVVDGVQEDLIQAMVDGGDCAPLTDYFSYANRQWTAGSGDVSNVYGQCVACEDGSDDDILGCIDVNAENYAADATVQSYDQYENVLCTYASCEATPGNGCMYADSFGFFNEFFGPSECELYGGTSCSDNNDLSGCIDANAENYDSEATDQAMDQYGNILCTYDSCESSPGNGCVYAVSFGAFASGFGPAECESYGGISCEVESNALTITTTVCDAASSVQMTGPWWGWDPTAGPAASDNGDGTWTFTFDPAPTDNMEYLLVVDGVQEDLIQAMVDGGDCAPLTDYFSYANRQWTAGSGDVSNVYGQCGACEVESTSLTITTTVCDAASSVQMTGPWWGWDPNAGPVASDNGDGSWTFTFDPAPTDNMEYLLVVDGVQEDLVNAPHPDLDGDGYGDLWDCAPVTDYFSYANRQWSVGSGDVSNVYGTCGVCSEVVFGCQYENATNYNEFANDDDGSCIFPEDNDCPADLNSDGAITTGDLLIFLGSFGTICL